MKVKIFLKKFYVLALHTPHFCAEGGQIHKTATIRARIIAHCWYWYQTNRYRQVYTQLLEEL